MRLYDRFISALSVAQAHKKLGGENQKFNQILCHHLSNISVELLININDNDTYDKTVQVVANLELKAISKQLNLYCTQDNVDSFENIQIYTTIEQIIKQFV